MKLNYIFTLLTLVIVFNFAPAQAQTKKKQQKTANKKATVKPTTKKPIKAGANKPKTAAKKLGEAASKAPADTARKGGQQNAANNTKNGGSLSEEIVVTTAYKPVLADAVKIRRNPDLEDKTPFKAPLSYTTLDKRLEKNSEIRQLDAMKMPAEQDSALLNNYVKVGLGSLKTTFGEAFFGNGKDNALQAGGYLKHIAQQGSDLYKQNYSHEQAGVFGKSINNNNTLSGRIDYDYRSNYFYGYNTLLPPPSKSSVPQQHFSNLGAEGEVAKNYKDTSNDFNYDLKLKGYIFSNAYKARESNVVVSGFLNEKISQFHAGLAASMDVATQKDSLYSYNNSLLRLNPYLKFQGDNYKVDAGVNMVKEFGFSTRIFIFPAAKFELQVIPKYVRMFLEAKGDDNRTSLRDLSLINPFIDQNITIKNSVDQLDIAAGLKGTLAPGLGFKATFFRNSVKNMPLFVSNYAPNAFNKFTVIYDNGSARVSGFTGDLDFKATDDFNLFGRVEFDTYKMASEAQAWNTPKFKLNAGTVIHISKKVDITGTLVFRGDTYDRVFLPGGNGQLTEKMIYIGSFADISGGAKYKASDKFSIFIQANNLLNSSNQTWLYYPNYRFNIFGGVGYAF